MQCPRKKYCFTCGNFIYIDLQFHWWGEEPLGCRVLSCSTSTGKPMHSPAAFVIIFKIPIGWFLSFDEIVSVFCNYLLQKGKEQQLVSQREVLIESDALHGASFLDQTRLWSWNRFTSVVFNHGSRPPKESWTILGGVTSRYFMYAAVLSMLYSSFRWGLCVIVGY